ncbi:MAG TPA: hypothetical protein PLL36_03525 [Candidatus Hydrogenedentes bacterium]|jgi:hypothetical protein|nr:hypothetical protein [Candidatus Hydrogenedentota bacterium]HQN00116.1 hypothetical protein [Candidatus Hydrogenedentota bacterium]
MVYKGHVENGMVILDEPADMQEGTPVLIEVADKRAHVLRRSLAERMRNVIGKAQDLPEDAAEHHDDYLYGTRKK